jgi:16S rRNA (cytosine1407-C5)-methyltransferase
MSPPLPKAYTDKLHTEFPYETVNEIVKGSLEIRVPNARVNTLKTTLEELLNQLKNTETKPQLTSWIKNALSFPYNTSRELTELSEYKKGELYLQSLSSMIPAFVLDPKENDVVLDMAAAPGSKTTQMAAMMSNKGKIIANDNSRERMFKLKGNLQNQGVTNTESTCMDGESLWKKYPEYFDKVLLDAPCSMEGTFCAAKPETYAYWSEKRSKQLAKLQKWLLRSAVSAAKPGATVVYSTCTLAPEENEEVIDWILQKEKGAVQLEDINMPGIKTYPAFLSYKYKTFHPDLQKCLRILPSHQMEGFFVAKLHKLRSTVHHET